MLLATRKSWTVAKEPISKECMPADRFDRRLFTSNKVIAFTKALEPQPPLQR